MDQDPVQLELITKIEYNLTKKIKINLNNYYNSTAFQNIKIVLIR